MRTVWKSREECMRMFEPTFKTDILEFFSLCTFSDFTLLNYYCIKINGLRMQVTLIKISKKKIPHLIIDNMLATFNPV